MHPTLRIPLEEQLIASAADGFEREMDEAFRKDVSDHIRQGELFIVTQNGVAEGFAVLQHFPEQNAAYIAGIAKMKKSPKGVIEAVVARGLDDMNVQIVSVRTQNDRVVQIMKDVCQTVVPVDREPDDTDFALLTQMNLITPNVDSTLVARGHYGGKPMIVGRERRRSENNNIRIATERLNYHKGDAMVLIGYRNK